MTNESDGTALWPNTFGERIAYLRKKQRLTQETVADRAGISIPYLSEIENNHRNPSVSTMSAIADALDVSLDWIVKGETHASGRKA